MRECWRNLLLYKFDCSSQVHFWSFLQHVIPTLLCLSQKCLAQGHKKHISDGHHGFWKNRSCETQLITVINDWSKILDAGGQVDIRIGPRRPLTPLLMNF